MPVDKDENRLGIGGAAVNAEAVADELIIGQTRVREGLKKEFHPAADMALRVLEDLDEGLLDRGCDVWSLRSRLLYLLLLHGGHGLNGRGGTITKGLAIKTG